MEQTYIDYVYQLFEFLHSHPELGMEEHNTSAFLASELENCGFQVIRGVGGKTGVIGILDSGQPGKTVALRADMDALPYVIDGVNVARHTCGHDSHSAMVMTAARMLAERGISCGRLKIIFQPAEETLAGSQSIIDSGLADDVDEMMGLHIRPKEELDFGQASPAVYHGASSRADIIVRGRAAHGARPQQGINAVEAAVAIVNAVNMIRVDPRVSHSVKVTRFFGGGKAVNIIPDKAEISFDMRAQSNQVMAELKEKLRSCAALAAGANGAEAEIHISEGVPAAEFDGGMVEDLRLVIGEVLGNENVMPPIVSPGGEDFHFYIQRLPHCKTAFLGLGSDAAPGLHHQDMCFNHKAMEYGAEILAGAVMKRMEG